MLSLGSGLLARQRRRRYALRTRGARGKLGDVRGPKHVIVCWGELVWDCFADDETQPILGGCGAAVAAQLAARGAQARLVSAIGDDEAGQRALSQLAARGVDTSELVLLPDQRTARVRIQVGADGAPRYSPDRRLDWGKAEFEASLTRACRGSDALLFSVFAQQSLLDLALLAQIDGPRCVGCDLNLRRPVTPEALARIAASADFVKLNLTELEIARSTLAGADPVAWFLGQGRTRAVAVTRGPAGASLTTATLHVERPPSASLPLRDAVGAGDAFFAGLGLALLEAAAPEVALERAVDAAERQLAERGGLPASN